MAKNLGTRGEGEAAGMQRGGAAVKLRLLLPLISIVASKPSEKNCRLRGFAIDRSFHCRDFAPRKINGLRNSTDPAATHG